MVASSQPSVKKGKPSITPGQALEILQQAVVNCQSLGVNTHISELYDNGERSVIVVLRNVDLKDGNLVWLG